MASFNDINVGDRVVIKDHATYALTGPGSTGLVIEKNINYREIRIEFDFICPYSLDYRGLSQDKLFKQGTTFSINPHDIEITRKHIRSFLDI